MALSPEAAQKQVQDAAMKLVNDVDVKYLRAMQRDMHLCAAKCCEDTKSSAQSVQDCVERCQSKTQRAQKFVQDELERFQQSLNRCVMQCQDNIKDKVSPNTPESEVTKLRQEFEACAVSCCEKQVKNVENYSKKINDTLKSGQF